MKKPKLEVRKFNLRMPVDLMEKAQHQADVMGISLNAFCLIAVQNFVRLNDRVARSPSEEVADSLIRRSVPADAPVAPRRVGRNDPCPCGSGRKAKHCHPENC